ncbi:MAG: toll/interleukin-1 receptor domain-containing protein [Vitreimonas sp.]
MADVFLSYAREDAARARQIAQGLEQAGLDVFWDIEIPPGATWADHIEQKLGQSKTLVVLWSEHSTKSQWVREEARMGRDKGVLIPVLIDGAQPPFGFGEVQAANLASWNGDVDDPGWRRLVDAVKGFSDGSARPAPQPMPSAPPRAAAAPARSWTPPVQAAATKRIPPWAWIAGGAGAVVVLLAIAVEMMPTPPVQMPAMTPSQAAGPPPATGESPQAIILAQLQQAHSALGQQGFQMVGQPFSGGLQQGQSWNVPAPLLAGVDYRIVGVCDRDCADLDLRVFDPQGTLVTQDTSTDSQPVVGVQPGSPGTFTVQVLMYNCSVEPCYYALALYGRAMQ